MIHHQDKRNRADVVVPKKKGVGKDQLEKEEFFMHVGMKAESSERKTDVDRDISY